MPLMSNLTCHGLTIRQRRDITMVTISAEGILASRVKHITNKPTDKGTNHKDAQNATYNCRCQHKHLRSGFDANQSWQNSTHKFFNYHPTGIRNSHQGMLCYRFENVVRCKDVPYHYSTIKDEKNLPGFIRHVF